MSRWIVVLVLVTVPGVTVPGVTAAPRPKDAPRPVAPLVGVWAPESYRFMGEEVGGSNREFTFEFTADGKLRSAMAGRPPNPAAPYTTDPTAKPAAIDWATDAGDVVGIYKLEKGILTLCFCGKEGRRRPTEFASPVGSRCPSSRSSGSRSGTSPARLPSGTASEPTPVHRPRPQSRRVAWPSARTAGRCPCGSPAASSRRRRPGPRRRTRRPCGAAGIGTDTSGGPGNENGPGSPRGRTVGRRPLGLAARGTYHGRPPGRKRKAAKKGEGSRSRVSATGSRPGRGTRPPSGRTGRGRRWRSRLHGNTQVPRVGAENAEKKLGAAEARSQRPPPMSARPVPLARADRRYSPFPAGGAEELWDYCGAGTRFRCESVGRPGGTSRPSSSRPTAAATSFARGCRYTRTNRKSW
jgi:uncharacterized protein (TIGR03067 family)